MKNISLEKSVRLVLKIGSSLLIKNNKFNKDWLETLIEDLIFLRKQKIEVIIVASGSVALGKNYLNIKKKKVKIQEKQAFAACGQVILMNNFMKILKKKKLMLPRFYSLTQIPKIEKSQLIQGKQLKSS